MLRAARFASQLDFTVDPETVSAIPALAERILLVARERWMLEFDRLLVGPAAPAALRLVSDAGLLRYLLPELQLQVAAPEPEAAGSAAGVSPAASLLDRTLAEVGDAPPEATARWGALLRYVGVPYAMDAEPEPDHRLIGAEIVERIALYLKWGTRRRHEVRALVLGDATVELDERSDAARAGD
jgi:poly(A) polymerase